MRTFTFEKNNFIENDTNKKNLLITLSQIETREYTYGYVFPIVKVLQEKYNIYYFFEGGKKAIELFGMSNVYRLHKGDYNKFKKPESGNFKRKKELETSDEHNQKIVDASIKRTF